MKGAVKPVSRSACPIPLKALNSSYLSYIQIKFFTFILQFTILHSNIFFTFKLKFLHSFYILQFYIQISFLHSNHWPRDALCSCQLYKKLSVPMQTLVGYKNCSPLFLQSLTFMLTYKYVVMCIYIYVCTQTTYIYIYI